MNLFDYSRKHKVLTSSRLKSTPPIGAPNATDTPTADAADNTWYTHTKKIYFFYNPFHSNFLTNMLNKEHIHPPKHMNNELYNPII